MLLNAHHEEVTFTLPKMAIACDWDMVLNTATTADTHRLTAEAKVPMPGRSLAVLRLLPKDGSKPEPAR
jgi:pullulanase/glycogen debranching enzyme